MHAMQRLLEIMARLRDPQEGCPWDREQTYASIVPHTLEEAYEVADAIERGDFSDLREELGDLLLQVVFYAQIAKEENRFDFEAVAEAINDKLVRRHPHVFADAVFGSAQEHRAAWEAMKAGERAEKNPEGQYAGALDGVAQALPALIRAEKLQRRASKVGFDWPEVLPVIDKVLEEVDEIITELEQGGSQERLQDEVGDLLFSAVNLARHLQVDPEAALRAANQKFEKRFRAMEQVLSDEGQCMRDCELQYLDAVWNRIKHL